MTRKINQLNSIQEYILFTIKGLGGTLTSLGIKNIIEFLQAQIKIAIVAILVNVIYSKGKSTY